MDCETDMQLKKIVLEASRALDENNRQETNLEKRQFLWAAELNVFEHERGCMICRPVVQDAPGDGVPTIL
jgi:hypothetical protein